MENLPDLQPPNTHKARRNICGNKIKQRKTPSNYFSLLEKFEETEHGAKKRSDFLFKTKIWLVHEIEDQGRKPKSEKVKSSSQFKSPKPPKEM